MMKLKCVLLLSVMFGQLNAQSGPNRVILDSGIIYPKMRSGGSTTGVRMYSRLADSIPGTVRVNLSPAALDTLSVLLSDIKRQRHFQKKIGPARYAKVYSKGRVLHLAIIPGWGILFFDQNRNYQYLIRNTRHAVALDHFIKSNWPD